MGVFPDPVGGRYCGVEMPSALRYWLELTPGQVAAIADLLAAGSRQSAEIESAAHQAETLARAELSAPVLNVARIGALLAEARRLRLSTGSIRSIRGEAIRALLTPAQTARLKLVADSVPLQPVFGAAECLDLLPVNRVGHWQLLLPSCNGSASTGGR